MKKIADLPETIAVFPLPGAILLPRARLPLHIFEPRYLAMVEDALKTDRRLIGMIQPRGGSGAAPALSSVGCAGRITSFSETDDGRYMITLTGISRFVVSEEIVGFVPYRRCKVDWFGFTQDVGDEEIEADFPREAFLEKLSGYLKVRNLGVDWSTLKEAEDELLINALAMLCPFAPEEKQALLEARSLADRRRVLETLIAFAVQSKGGSDEVVQ
ncbi:MAG: ATP-dependent protease [Rhodobacterales bacterium 17-64-5]|nr:MAG: ATP-dependent protease [Rhodobacterales bacterium 17-64-5]